MNIGPYISLSNKMTIPDQWKYYARGNYFYATELKHLTLIVTIDWSFIEIIYFQQKNNMHHNYITVNPTFLFLMMDVLSYLERLLFHVTRFV